MSFLQVDKIALGVATDANDPRWQCQCSVHAGADIGNMLTWPETAIRLHSALAVLREQEALTRLPRWQRAASWHARVASALSTYDEMNAAGVAWRAPGALRHWAQI
jgi:hypothetical protein